VIEQSIRESVAHWKDIKKQQLKNGEAVELALNGPPPLMARQQRNQREFSGQRLLNNELNQEQTLQP
jgi:hypothetical protein